jgi:hypothetical protein
MLGRLEQEVFGWLEGLPTNPGTECDGECQSCWTESLSLNQGRPDADGC